MAVAVKESISRFETLRTKHHLYGCNREIVLSGFYPQVDPYMACSERAFLRLRIQLVGEDECSFTVNELSQIFSEFIRVNYPTGRTEFCRSIVANKCYAELNYRFFADNPAKVLYDQLKKELF